MNKKVLLALLYACACTFSSCSHDDDGIIDTPPKTTQKENAKSEDTKQTENPTNETNQANNATTEETNKQLGLLNGRWAQVSEGGNDSLDGDIEYTFNTEKAVNNRFEGSTKLHEREVKFSCEYIPGENNQNKLVITFAPDETREETKKTYRIDSLSKDDCKLPLLQDAENEANSETTLALKKKH